MTHWITTHEASQISGYHMAYLRHLIRSGQIKAEKRGGEVMGPSIRST